MHTSKRKAMTSYWNNFLAHGTLEELSNAAHNYEEWAKEANENANSFKGSMSLHYSAKAMYYSGIARQIEKEIESRKTKTEK